MSPTQSSPPLPVRHLVIVLGDQLNAQSSAFDGFDTGRDAVWMTEVEEEATHVWCHKLRLVTFFSAMRHFRDELRGSGRRVVYHELGHDAATDRGRNHAAVLQADVQHLVPTKLIVVEPGDYRVKELLTTAASALGVALEIRSDTDFYCSTARFGEWARGRSTFVMEHFYREMRTSHGVLVDEHGKPERGHWNFDHENRRSFGRRGPGAVPRPPVFAPDTITRAVIEMVERRFAKHPGQLDSFDVPVVRAQARQLLNDFVTYRLPDFGAFQDAMWTADPVLYHSRLSVALNLHLISPRECVDAAVDAYRSGAAPLNSVEGFVRQILGWREFMRGTYWLFMPDYAEHNALGAELEVPPFYWTGDTDMNCVHHALSHLIKSGYAHHIHRLMVLGLLCQLSGVHPRRFHEWHMAMHLDAIDWVSLPNTLGMSQYGDGGLVATKPYCASGQYINRMSNYCAGCRYDPKKASGADACPFTTLYWDFLDRHAEMLKANPRMRFQIDNVVRKRTQTVAMRQIRERAAELRRRWFTQA